LPFEFKPSSDISGSELNSISTMLVIIDSTLSSVLNKYILRRVSKLDTSLSSYAYYESFLLY
jgi:hypothetical protein